jgi:murein L,D-transpeptidase YafK
MAFDYKEEKRETMKLSWIVRLTCIGLGVALLNLLPFTTGAIKRHAYQTLSNPYIVIDKSDYELSVYDDEGWYATYPVVFGNNTLADKKMEGDRLTPEGDFKITYKKKHEKWDKFMLLDYPTKESIEKFKQRKAKGEVPKNATVGGGIGIHGTWPHEDYAIDYYMNWTNGCISMKNSEVQELYNLVPNGTKVTIRP